MEEYEKNTGMEALEFVIGTRWAVWDLYQYILDNDPTVETVIRAIIENELPIWPEHFDFDRIDQLKKEFGSLFWLLYMNSAANPELTDFDVDKIRSYELKGDQLIFDSNEDDVLLEKKWEKQPLEQGVKLERGTEWNKHTWDALIGKGRGDYFRVKYG